MSFNFRRVSQSVCQWQAFSAYLQKRLEKNSYNILAIFPLGQVPQFYKANLNTRDLYHDKASLWSSNKCEKFSSSFVNTNPDIVFKTPHFLHNQGMGPISQSVCPWQAFSAMSIVTLQLLRPTSNLQRKGSVGFTAPGIVSTKLHFLHNLLMGPLSQRFCPCKPLNLFSLVLCSTLAYGAQL